MNCAAPPTRVPIPESRTILVFEDSYSIKVSQLSAPDASPGTGNFYAKKRAVPSYVVLPGSGERSEPLPSRASARLACFPSAEGRVWFSYKKGAAFFCCRATAPSPDVPTPEQLTVSKTAENSKFQHFQPLMEISDLGTSMRAPGGRNIKRRGFLLLPRHRPGFRIPTSGIS